MSAIGFGALTLLLVVSADAARDRKAPRIVAAAVQDVDGDSRADRVRLTYSERIRHAVDSDGRYPFVVTGYQIRSIGAPRRKTLVLALVEKRSPDYTARPSIRYTRTKSKPVRDRAGNQAAAQRFTATAAHGNEPPPVAGPLDTIPPETTITSGPTGTATTRGASFTYASPDATAVFECALDGNALVSCPRAGQSYTGLGDGSHTFQVRARDPAGNVDATPELRNWSVDGDGDGTLAPADCAPDNPAIHPGAGDAPELSFADTNCDGIDGTEANAIFVSPTGDDANAGTKAAPVRQLATAVTKAVAAGKQVYAAGGVYGGVATSSGVAIYGGYGTDWSRSLLMVTTLTSSTDGVLATGASIVLQHLTVHGGRSGASGYGIRLVSGASATLERVVVTAADGTAGSPGLNGPSGGPGSPGGNGRDGACDGGFQPRGGLGGTGYLAGLEGGEGGPGGVNSIDGGGGWPAATGAPGGAGGASGNPGKPGRPGANGANGSPGVNGSGGTNSLGAAAATWTGSKGQNGSDGTHGGGGGGGGGGGAQDCFFCINGVGNSGGGGGGAGEGGKLGAGGGYGGGSFGIYLHNSTVSVTNGSLITAGKGGAGGDGGHGGAGGNGGAGGVGATRCLSEVGAGGNGGQGGYGGRAGAGGGGAGGPSIGVFKVGASTATVDSSSLVTARGAGPGGEGGEGGLGHAPAGANGISAGVYPP